MSRSRRFRWLRFVPLLVVLVLGIVWGRKALTPPLHVAHFPDGTTVTVHRIDWGSSTHVEGSWWQHLLGWFSPSLGPEIHRAIGVSPDTPVLWISEAGPSAGKWDRITIFDEHGCEISAGGGLIDKFAMADVPKLASSDVYGLALREYPRRARVTGIRFRDRMGKTIGEVRLPNPRRRTEDPFTPEPLSVESELGGAEIRLVGFRTGVPWFSWSRRYELETQVTVEVRRGGSPDYTWAPYHFTVTDPTGNVFNEQPGLTGRKRTGRRHTLSFSAGLFPDDPAYRVRIACIRTPSAKFAADELWTLRDVPMPDFGDEKEISEVWERGGARLQARAFTRARGTGLPTLLVLSNAPAFEPHLSLVNATDQSGRQLKPFPKAEQVHPITVTRNGKAPPISWTSFELPFYPQKGIKSVTLTLAVQRPKWVEFTAAPTWPAKKGVSTAAK